MDQDEKWMKIAIQEAIKADKENEVPIGTVIVKNNQLIAKAHNQSISMNNPTAHAEIQAIKVAGNILKNYRITGTTIYTTLEPCAMCLGAIMHARIEKLIFGAFDYKTGVCGSCVDLTDSVFFSHRVITKGGVMEKQCSELLKKFFKLRR